MLIHEIKLKNFLSFGDKPQSLRLSPLNVIIGPNGSGKSNFLESIELVRSTPEQLLKPILEGGGDRDWLWKAGCAGRMPRVVACGSRKDAYDAFSTAMNKGESAMLLVDSELLVAEDCQQGKVDKRRPWRHLGERQGDHWAKPAEAAERDCHLMVQCMEAWFLADRKTLQDFFGHGFHVQSLPAPEKNIESIPRQVQALQG